MDKLLQKTIKKAKKAGQQTGKIRRFPRVTRTLKGSKAVLSKKLQTYKPEVADILPLALPYSVKKQFIEIVSQQADGALTKCYTLECEDWSVSLSYVFPPALASQKKVKYYPVLGRDALPVFLAMISLAGVQKSSRICFSPKDIADLIYQDEPPGLWQQKIRDIILSMSLSVFTVAHKKQDSFAIQHFGDAVFAGRRAIWVRGFQLKPGDIYFHFNEDWLVPSSPYLKTHTVHLKQIERLPRYMQNGYLWLARNQNTINHKMNPPYIKTFLKSGFKLTGKEITQWKKWGELKPKFDAFVEAMKHMRVLSTAQILKAEPPSRDLSLSKIKFTLTREFEDLKADQLSLTPELEDEVLKWLWFRKHYEKSAKYILANIMLKAASDQMTKHIESGDFDKLVKRGYYSAQEKKAQNEDF